MCKGQRVRPNKSFDADTELASLVLPPLSRTQPSRRLTTADPWRSPIVRRVVA